MILLTHKLLTVKAKIYFLHSGDKVPRYIGSTTQDLKVRRQNHASDFRLGSPKIKWAKSVERVEIELIEECKIAARYDREAYWTEVYSDTVLNINKGTKHTEEFKIFISKALTGLKRPKENYKKAALARGVPVIFNGKKYPSLHHAARETGANLWNVWKYGQRI
jgi:hypothetical protein